jgi:hypothetical protein
MPEVSDALILALAFPLWWMLVCVVIAHVGGWHQLAASYRADQRFSEVLWRFQSGQMRWWMGYNHCLTIGADASGLHLAVLFLFRPGHPPLFVRWEELTVGTKKLLFMTSFEFRFRSAPEIPFLVNARVAEKLKVQAGDKWPLERVEPT